MRPTVLIADTDELLASAYRAFLLAEGYETDCVTNGLDCLDRLRNRPPQALIVDADLPWGSGAGVLEVMSQDASIANVPVVILTARPTALPWPAPGRRAPVTLIKPIAPASVASMLRHLLEAEPACMA